MLLPVSLYLVLILPSCEAQFFTKTTNSIPRMGRRSEQMLPTLVKRVARTLRFVIDMVQEYDLDGNGELSPEELIEIPLIQNAVRNYMDVRDLREVKALFHKYAVARGKRYGNQQMEKIPTFEEERSEAERDDQPGDSINGQLVM